MIIKINPIKIIFVIALFFILPKFAVAATYYVDGSAVDNSGSGSVSSPKKYIESGIALLSSLGGDTLIIGDGVYSTANDQITNVPTGTVGNYNEIRAQNAGSVVITTAYGLALGDSTRYLILRGLKFDSPTFKEVRGQYIKIFSCAFKGSNPTNNYPTIGCGTNDVNTTAYILFEDCWSYGSGGRYNFIAYNSNYVIFRRCVMRHDGGWTDAKGDPEAGIAIYNSSHVELQNNIVIDSDLAYHTWQAGYYIICNTASPNGTIDVNVRGNIALNGKAVSAGSGFMNDGDCAVSMPVFTDNVAWDMTYDPYANGSGLCNSNGTISRMTAGYGYTGFANYGSGSMSVINSIVTTMTPGADFYPTISASYVDRYNIANYQSCINCVTYNPQTNGLLYLPRIEDGSTLKTAGFGGDQMGAQIVKRIGVSGTLWGETGYSDATSENLWPFPNEDRIKSDMAEVSTRGFAGGNSKDGSSQTLTKYIWEYLGNQIPAEIYGSSFDTTPPAAPSGLSVN